MTQIMNLLHPASDIQETILFLPRVESGRDSVTERQLWSIVSVVYCRKQRRKQRRMRASSLADGNS